LKPLRALVMMMCAPWLNAGSTADKHYFQINKEMSMQIETTFSPGDKAWIFSDYARQVTIGQVRVTITDSPGLDGESTFSNYGPQKGREEQYMCVETGVNCGQLYTPGKNIFATEEECEQANAERIAEIAAERKAAIERERQKILGEENYLRAKLAHIEQLKATQPA
jgi:hypothetical protein